MLSKTRLEEFFRQRRSAYDWIHQSGVYDVLLLIFGLPLALWGTVNGGKVVPNIDGLDAFPRALIYGYLFIVSLMAFRLLFSYARWVFPKIEIENPGRVNPFRQRTVWAMALASLFWPALYDVVKFCVSHFGLK